MSFARERVDPQCICISDEFGDRVPHGGQRLLRRWTVLLSFTYVISVSLANAGDDIYVSFQLLKSFACISSDVPSETCPFLRD